MVENKKFHINKKSKLISQNFSGYRKNCPHTESVYIEVLRKMSGEKKIKTAFELYEIALNLCIQSILEQNPEIKDNELRDMLFERFGYDSGRFADKSNR